MTRIIAEIGINHNGDVRKAIDMVSAAKEAGAHLVKFQKRDVELCYSDEELARPCDSPWGTTVEDKVRGRELSWDDFQFISDHCKRVGIGWGCSCFDLRSLAELVFYFGDHVAFHKVPSCMAIHEAFLRQVASYGRMTLISTGLAPNMSSIAAMATFFEVEKTTYVLNVTTPIYPCPPSRCGLRRIATLREEFERGLLWADRVKDGPWPNCSGIGYSGHEVGVLPSVIAAYAGAVYVERHFTLDRTWYGADQASSLEPEGLRRLCRDIGQLDEIFGDGLIRLSGDEKNPVPNLKEVEL